MFYQGGEIPPYVNYIGISWVRTITHTQEPMTLVMDSWHTFMHSFMHSLIKEQDICFTRVGRYPHV